MDRVYHLFQTMYRQMGPQGWWPAESKSEIVLGAILVQNTNWQNAAKSLQNLRLLTQLHPEKIAALTQADIIEAIRPSGFYTNKGRAIIEFFAWFQEFDFSFDRIKKVYGTELHKQLLSLRGIGEETADVLLLYVFDEKVFIADKYAQRLFTYLGWSTATNYRQLHQQVDLSEFTLAEAQEFHGLIDEFGKIFLKSPTTWQQSFLYEINH